MLTAYPLSSLSCFVGLVYLYIYIVFLLICVAMLFSKYTVVILEVLLYDDAHPCDVPFH